MSDLTALIAERVYRIEAHGEHRALDAGFGLSEWESCLNPQEREKLALYTVASAADPIAALIAEGDDRNLLVALSVYEVHLRAALDALKAVLEAGR